MHQLQATAKLLKLDELPHLHLSHTFTYYWPSYFGILSNYNSPNSPPFHIFLPEAPLPLAQIFTRLTFELPGVELLPNLRTWRLHYLMSVCSQGCVCVIVKMCRQVPISGPSFPTFSHIPFSACTNFSHIVPHIQSVGTVSMEDKSMEIEVTWVLHEASIDPGLATHCHTDQLCLWARWCKKGKKCLKGLEDDKPSSWKVHSST